jgi:plastocyanin
MKLSLIILLALAVVVSTGIASANTAQVKIDNFKFIPDQITIRRGDTVTWTHPGPASHTVKFADSESPVLSNGAQYSKTFNAPGNFDYICGIHPYMKGRVIVQ